MWGCFVEREQEDCFVMARGTKRAFRFVPPCLDWALVPGRDHFAACAHLMRMSAISGRENSIGGRSPALSMSRTFVPDGAILCSGPCGQVLDDAAGVD